MEAKTLLAMKLEETGLGLDFCRKARAMGFLTLEELLSETPEALRSKKGFDYDWLAELASFLSERRLLYLLQPTPGKTPI